MYDFRNPVGLRVMPLLTVLGIALAPAAQAAPITAPGFFTAADTTIDFDGLAQEASLSFLSGVSFSAEGSGNRGSTQTDAADFTGRFSDSFTVYSSSTGPSPVGGGGSATSTPNYVAGNFRDSPRDAADMRFDFLTAVTAFGMFVIDNDFSTGRLSAYAADGSLIESITLPQVSEGGVAYHGIDGEGAEIAYAILDGAGGAALDSTFIDDLSYRMATVPLPASLPMLLAGLGLFGWMRRRG